MGASSSEDRATRPTGGASISVESPAQPSIPCAVSDRDIYYLQSILRQLRQISAMQSDGPSLGGEVLADNINWLDCFIELHGTGFAPPNHVEVVNP